MGETWILYQTTNLVNGKIYVGVHKVTKTSYSKHYIGSGTALRLAIEKYGKNAFIRTTLAEFSCPDDAYSAELDMVTEEFCDRNDTYNMKTGGLGGVGGSLSAEIREKMSASRKGKNFRLDYVTTEETKAKLRLSLTGNKNSLGKLRSEETKKKMSDSRTGKVFHSAETKAKIGEANRRRVITEETKAKLRTNRKGLNAGSAHCRSVAIVINGNYYGCVTIAAKVVEVNRQTIMDRVKNTKPRWTNWRYATEDEKLEHSPRNIALIGEIPN